MVQKKAYTTIVRLLAILLAITPIIGLADDDNNSAVRFSDDDLDNTATTDERARKSDVRPILHAKPLRPEDGSIAVPVKPNHNRLDAISPDKLREMKEQNRIKADNLRDRAMERDKNIRDTMHDRNEPVKENMRERSSALEEHRTERRAHIDEVRKNRIRAYIERTLRRFTAAIERLVHIGVRIEGRIEKFEERGLTVDEAKRLLAVAREKISFARTSVNAIPAIIEEVLASDDPKQGFERVRQAFNTAKQHIKEAHSALVQAIRALKAVAPDANVDGTELR